MLAGLRCVTWRRTPRTRARLHPECVFTQGATVNFILSPSPKRILIADDQLPARELLRAILSNAGYEVMEASDGLEAMVLASEAVPAPDLILLDIQMPGL